MSHRYKSSWFVIILKEMLNDLNKKRPLLLSFEQQGPLLDDENHTTLKLS